MIRPAQLKLLARARNAKASDPAVFDEILKKWGGVDTIDALTVQGFDRLMDHFTICGFLDKGRPILSKATLDRVMRAKRALEITDHAFVSRLRRDGAAGLEMMTGTGLLSMLTLFEAYGMCVTTFNSSRSSISDKQLKLLKIAQRKTKIPDERYYPILQHYGGVNYSHNLDQRGFTLILAFLEAAGFDREPVARAAPAFGRRPGFASPEQVELIRALWREWTGPSAGGDAAVEAGLNAWLERYHRASSLRFLTAAGAGKVITALRAMKSRLSDARSKVPG